MILADMAAAAAESPGSNAAGQGATDGLENHCGGNVTVGSNPTPSADQVRRTGRTPIGTLGVAGTDAGQTHPVPVLPRVGAPLVCSSQHEHAITTTEL